VREFRKIGHGEDLPRQSICPALSGQFGKERRACRRQNKGVGVRVEVGIGPTPLLEGGKFLEEVGPAGGRVGENGKVTVGDLERFEPVQYLFDIFQRVPPGMAFCQPAEFLFREFIGPDLKGQDPGLGCLDRFEQGGIESPPFFRPPSWKRRLFVSTKKTIGSLWISAYRGDC